MTEREQFFRKLRELVALYKPIADELRDRDEFYSRLRVDGLSKLEAHLLLRDLHGCNLQECMDADNVYEKHKNGPS